MKDGDLKIVSLKENQVLRKGVVVTPVKEVDRFVVSIRPNGSRRVRSIFVEEEGSFPTQQQFKDDYDVGSILNRYKNTGVIPQVRKANPMYLDMTQMPQDYAEAMQRVDFAKEAFSNLPSRVRERFQNDPGEFVEFVANPKNQDELVELGLAEPRKGAKKAQDGPLPGQTIIPGSEGDSSPSKKKKQPS